MRLSQSEDVIHLQIGEHGQFPYDYSERLYHLTGWYNASAMLGLSISSIIARLFTLVTALTAHEFAHAWTADQLGDDTPRLYGRLTLNPLAHLDPIGSLMLILVGFGWAKPVPINPLALQRRNPAGAMLVAAAGPFSNLLLAIMAALPFKMGLLRPSIFPGAGNFPTLSTLLVEFIFLNLILAFFNLIPLFPLDGEKVADFFLPPGGRDMLHRLRPYGGLILMALLFLGPVIGLDIFRVLIGWPAEQVLRLLVL